MGRGKSGTGARAGRTNPGISSLQQNAAGLDLLPGRQATNPEFEARFEAEQRAAFVQQDQPRAFAEGYNHPLLANSAREVDTLSIRNYLSNASAGGDWRITTAPSSDHVIAVRDFDWGGDEGGTARVSMTVRKNPAGGWNTKVMAAKGGKKYNYLFVGRVPSRADVYDYVLDPFASSIKSK